jgi:rhodanese-related sulfurtransferase
VDTKKTPVAGGVYRLAFPAAGIEYHAMSSLFGWFRRSSPAPSWIEAHDLAKRLSADVALLVLDVRGPEEFIGPLGHITGAMNLPLDELPGHLTELTDDGRPIVVVCKTDRRSSVAAQCLRDAGSPSVSVLRGGMEQWRALGLPVA